MRAPCPESSMHANGWVKIEVEKEVGRTEAIRYTSYAGWSSLVARWAHNPKVAGSNPAPATNPFNKLRASGANPKTTLAHDSHRCRFCGLYFWLVRGATGWLQNHLDHVPVCLPFAVCHCPAVDIHCGLNAGMAHQLSLYPNWCFGLVQPRPEAVPEGLPAHRGCDPRCFRCWLDVLLLNFLLMVWFIGCGLANNHPSCVWWQCCRYASSSPTSSGARGTKSREYSVFTSPTRP